MDVIGITEKFCLLRIHVGDCGFPGVDGGICGYRQLVRQHFLDDGFSVFPIVTPDCDQLNVFLVAILELFLVVGSSDKFFAMIKQSVELYGYILVWNPDIEFPTVEDGSVVGDDFRAWEYTLDVVVKLYFAL